MRTVVNWVLARRLRLIVLAVVFAPLFQVVSAALIALDTAEFGVRRGVVTAGLSIVGVLVIVFASGGSVLWLGGIGALSLLLGVLLGLLVRSGGGLQLAFQSVVLLGVLAVLVATLFGIGPAELLGPTLDRLIAALQRSGATPDQIQAFKAALPLALGWVAAAFMVELLAALFLAYWWIGFADDKPGFGEEFRRLRLGMVLGVPAAVVFVVSLVWRVPLIENLAPLAVFAFLFQGLAVLHAWAHAKHWHAGLLVAVYVLLVSPLMVVPVIGLGGVGLIDTWFDLRARLRK